MMEKGRRFVTKLPNRGLDGICDVFRQPAPLAPGRAITERVPSSAVVLKVSLDRPPLNLRPSTGPSETCDTSILAKRVTPQSCRRSSTVPLPLTSTPDTRRSARRCAAPTPW